MAIDTGSLIDTWGTTDTLDNTTSAVNDAAFSDGTNDLSAWTNDDDAPMATFILRGQYPSGTLSARPRFIVHAQLVDVEGTTDTAVPDANHSPHAITTLWWNPDLAATTDDTMVGIGALPNTETSQVYHFYIENQTGVQLSASWTLDVIPMSEKPHT